VVLQAVRKSYVVRCYNLLIRVTTDVAPEVLEHAPHRKYTYAVDIWALGVVLYICLCGFPPFSDEVNTHEFPSLAAQIKAGHYVYPSPYWDEVGDPALDLIDRMLTVDVDERITVDEALDHPWITQKEFNPNDSTDGLTGAIASMDFTRKKIKRERTLLSTLNEVQVDKVIQTKSNDPRPVKVYSKNPAATPDNTESVNDSQYAPIDVGKEDPPAANRDPKEFMELGGKADDPLFGTDGGSHYSKTDLAKAK
jgi:serine/threonine-protein kinase CHEK2